MNSNIEKILKKIENNGFEAYVVGGFVRDNLLGIYTTDVDICTNALPKDIIRIFKVKKETENYGSVSLNDGTYNYDITTYRKESFYENRRPQSIEYTNNLILDIKRRDFTINSLCMSSSGQIFDYLNGKKDIKSKTIRVIGDVDTKLTEDPLRIMRAVGFAAVLDFKLDSKIISFIKNNKNLIESLSFTRKREELDKIFSSRNALNGLNLLKKLDLLDTLKINYDTIVVVPDILGVWAQISFDEHYPFTKNSLDSISKIRILIQQKMISDYDLYNYGLYICSVAADILNYPKEDLNIRFKELPIYSKKDLKISSKDIIESLNIEPSNKIKEIFNDLVLNVINKNLVNERDILIKYIQDKWK